MNEHMYSDLPELMYDAIVEPFYKAGRRIQMTMEMVAVGLANKSRLWYYSEASNSPLPDFFD